MDYGHWKIEYVGDFDPLDWFGFVYIIRNVETNQKYIGRKQLNSKRRKRVKNRKNRKIHITESDWREYKSSSKVLIELIDKTGKDQFEFFILKLCKTKRDLGYSEVSEQFKRDVLNAKLETGEREYYNQNIMSRWFVASENRSEEHNQKIGAANKGNKRPDLAEYNRNRIYTEETREKLRQANLGKKTGPCTEERKQNISLARLGKPHPHKGTPRSEETREKMRQAKLDSRNHLETK
jgi:hypothetical protein